MMFKKKKKKDVVNQAPTLGTVFSPACTVCDIRMTELVYSREVHQEMYWCSQCGTLLIEVDGKDTWMKPDSSKKYKRIPDKKRIDIYG